MQHRGGRRLRERRQAHQDDRALLRHRRLRVGLRSHRADWHRRLLERMAIATEARPAVLAAGTVGRLGELLRFRHVVRHLYAYELERDQVFRLLTSAIGLWPQLQVDFDRFGAWLNDLSGPA